ncbi:MAG: proline racemase family protein [bacterium]|nr:MAG: proline racemase family protein [bacterium]
MKIKLLNQDIDWSPPKNWQKILTLDYHTAGEPLRVILAGMPELPGDTILEKRRYIRDNYDHLRTTLMWEPRGHADMYGCLITPAVTPQADFGVLFLHNEGYSSMCGHGIIAVSKAVLDLGLLPMTEPITSLKIDTPAGLVTSYARISADEVQCVYFHNVPSFVVKLDDLIDVPGLGKVRFDLAFGGAYYAFVDAEQLDLNLTPEQFQPLIEYGMKIKRAIMKDRQIVHPLDPDLSFLYGTIFTGPPLTPEGDSRNVCIFADGEVDRSPTGTGVSARMAIHYQRGELKVNESMVIESIIGTQFTGRVVEQVRFASYPAVVPEVEGSAYLTGRNEFYLDPADPLKNGFFLR